MSGPGGGAGAARPAAPGPRVGIVVQARMGSTRLPGKVLADLHGRPMLERIVERLRRARSADAIVIATTVLSEDDAVAALGARVGVAVHRGPVDDVLARYAEAAAAHRLDVVVRITADCPLVDPGLLDACVERLVRDPRLDYVSTTLRRTYPRGLDVEVLTRSALERAHREATDASDREHVTRFVWRHPQRFALASVEDVRDHAHLRWTVDTPLDLEVVRAVYDALYDEDPAFPYARALRHAAEHPDVHARNADVPQRTA